MTLYAYARASTDKQEESPDVQKGLIQRWALVQGHGKLQASDFFVDIDVSGSTPFVERKAGGALYRRVRRGDTIIVARMDRAFRSMADFCLCVADWERQGVRLCLADMQIDMTSPIGRMCAHMCVAFAEFERAMIRTRITEAIRHRRLTGRQYTGNAPLGFRWGRPRWDKYQKKRVRPILINEKEKAIMQEIFMMRQQYTPMPWVDIVAELNRRGYKRRNGTPFQMHTAKAYYDAEKTAMARQDEHVVSALEDEEEDYEESGDYRDGR
jgi:DNA invertase Pin-like site-specific DNA recombinase